MTFDEAIATLEGKIKAVFDKGREDIERESQKGSLQHGFARTRGEQCAREAAEWRREIEALKAPIISMVAHEGRVLVATTHTVFELKDGKLVRVAFDRVQDVAA